MKINEEMFKQRIRSLEPLRGKFKAVTGPGRSGAVASVYASYFLGIPFIPFGEIPEACKPILIIDTATLTGKTLRKAVKKIGNGASTVALFGDAPIKHFWYEELKNA